MKSLFLFLLLSCAAVTSAVQQDSSVQLMERFSAAVRESPAVEMHFSLLGADGRGRAITPLEGVIYRQGDDFVMLNPQVEVYASGETKWIYTVDNNEVIIMPYDPASIDLAENPLALFSAQLFEEYSLPNKPNRLVEGGREVTEITLTPKGKNAPYASILLRIDTQSVTPHSVKYIAKDGTWYEATITSYSPLKQKIPPERFIFQTNAHPGVYVTDLR
jgi:outer membrane lipoprotein-sorting protein